MCMLLCSYQIFLQICVKELGLIKSNFLTLIKMTINRERIFIHYFLVLVFFSLGFVKAQKLSTIN